MLPVTNPAATAVPAGLAASAAEAARAARQVVEAAPASQPDPAQAASQAARPDTLVSGMTALGRAELSFEAALAVARVEERTTGVLLDLKA